MTLIISAVVKYYTEVNIHNFNTEYKIPLPNYDHRGNALLICLYNKWKLQDS